MTLDKNIKDPLFKVIVLSTGRVGSMTFARACGRIENYRSGHETNRRQLFSHKISIDYGCIEVDNRLSWAPGLISNIADERTVIVHLTRTREKVQKSFLQRSSRGIIRAYKKDITMGAFINYDDQKIISDYIETIEANIKILEKCCKKFFTIDIDNPTSEFIKFYDFIRAEGDINECLAEFSIKHNASKQKKRLIPVAILWWKIKNCLNIRLN
jgi:hypothetical protein